MVNNGIWKPDVDYSVIPEGKMCDYDYVARYMQRVGYTPKTSIENVVMQSTADFDNEEEFVPKNYSNLMINMEAFADFIEANSGFEEFDY